MFFDIFVTTNLSLTPLNMLISKGGCCKGGGCSKGGGCC